MREIIQFLTEWLVLWPAEVLGLLIGHLFHITYLIFGFTAAVLAGVAAWEVIPHRYIRVAAGVFLGVWILMIFAASEEHAVSGIYRAMNADSDDY